MYGKKNVLMRQNADRCIFATNQKVMHMRHLQIVILALWAIGIGHGLQAQDSLPVDSLAADTLLPDSAGLLTVSPDTPEVRAFLPPDSGTLALEAEYTDENFHVFSLASPYHTIVSHLYFLQEETYHPDSAAMTLYIKDPKSQQARDLSIKLKQFMDGTGHFIDPDELPSDPNYVDTLSGKHKYVPIPEEPDIFVYKKGNRWVYSFTTVQNIDRLHNRVFPFGMMEWLPEWTHNKVGGLQLWQYLAILLFILFTFLVHKLLTVLISLLLRRFLARFVREDKIVHFFTKIARPISLLILLYILWSIVPALQLPIGVNKWVILGFRIMIPVFYMLICLQLANLFMAFYARNAEKTESTLDDQLIPLLRNLIKGIIVVFFLIFILSELKVDITALIGGVAFGGLALALAAQDTVKNLFGSLLIFVDRPFQIGDWIVVDGHEGVVEEVSVRSTRIRTFANSLIYIPNGKIADSAINNMGLRTFRRFSTKIGVTYDTPPHLLEVFVAGIRELIGNHPDTRKEGYEVAFNEMGDSALLILINTFFKVDTWSEELKGKQELLMGIMELAETLGIGFAFPTQTIHIENFPEKQSLTPTHPATKADYEAKMQAYTASWIERIQRAHDSGTDSASATEADQGS